VPADLGRVGWNEGRSPLLTPAEVVELLDHRVTTKTLSNWRYSDEPCGPPFKKLGNRVFYPLAAVEKWMEANEYSSIREYWEKRDARAPQAPAAPAPPAEVEASLIAEFDARVAELRDLLIARLAELPRSQPPVKRSRGRPPGSRDKGPRRSRS
jgi:hypothetical protein